MHGFDQGTVEMAGEEVRQDKEDNARPIARVKPMINAMSAPGVLAVAATTLSSIGADANMETIPSMSTWTRVAVQAPSACLQLES